MLETRDYQVRIIDKAITAYHDGLDSILIVSPTGSGKTYMSYMIAKKMQEQHPELRIIFSAMRRKLLQQAKEANEIFKIQNIQYISMFDKNPPECDLLISDEYHHTGADTCITFRNKTKNKYELGLTGTPIRTDKIKLSCQKVITDCGVRFLIEKGYLSPFEYYTIPEYNLAHIAKLYTENTQKWGKSIFFVHTMDECYQLAQYIKQAGAYCEVMHCKMKEAEQDNILEKFETGEVQALINIDLLVEGFDSPALETVWIRDNAKLPTEQMAGRVLRKDPKNPAKIAKIIQSNNTPYIFSKTAKPLKECIYTNNKWLDLKPGPQIQTVIRNVQNRLLGKQIILPNYLGETHASKATRH